MKKFIPLILLSVFILTVNPGCIGEKLGSVALSPSGDTIVNLGDSIQIEVTTDPPVVDSVTLSEIDKLITHGIDGTYTVWWKAETTDTLHVTATAWLGDESLESEDTLHIVGFGGFFPYTQNSKWTYSFSAKSVYTDYQDPSESSSDSFTGTMVKEVIGQEFDAWRMKQVITYHYSDGEEAFDTVNFYVEIEEDSVYIYETLDQLPVSAMPAVPKKGDTWDGVVPTYYDEPMDFEVLQDDLDTLNYNNCLRIKGVFEEPDYEEEEYYEYWAPNLGMIVVQVWGVDETPAYKDERKVEIVLIEFTTD